MGLHRGPLFLRDHPVDIVHDADVVRPGAFCHRPSPFGPQRCSERAERLADSPLRGSDRTARPAGNLPVGEAGIVLHDKGGPESRGEIGDSLPYGKQLDTVAGGVRGHLLVIAQRHLGMHVPLPHVSVEDVPRNRGEPGAGLPAAVGGDPGTSAQIGLLQQIVRQVDVSPQPDEQSPERLPVGIPHAVERVQLRLHPPPLHWECLPYLKMHRRAPMVGGPRTRRGPGAGETDVRQHIPEV